MIFQRFLRKFYSEQQPLLLLLHLLWHHPASPAVLLRLLQPLHIPLLLFLTVRSVSKFHHNQPEHLQERFCFLLKFFLFQLRKPVHHQAFFSTLRQLYPVHRKSSVLPSCLLQQMSAYLLHHLSLPVLFS